MSTPTIKCQKCGTEMEVSEAVIHQIEEQARAADEIKNKNDIENARKAGEENALKKSKEEREREREKDRKAMLAWQDEQKKKISANYDLELKAAREESERKDQELKESKKREYEFLQEKKKFKEKEESFDLEVARKVDKEADKIREETEAKADEKHHLIEKDFEQKMEAMKKSLEEAQRKANQGSQQLQGEVLELELEELLIREFPVDQIEPVGKGVKGADLVQVVKDQIGRVAGKILWESKRTKAFEGNKWIPKLKEDMFEEKAEVAVIVSTVLPDDIKFFGQRDGVYITSFDLFLALARILRKSLLDLASTKASSVGKNEKIELLYQYITSTEFAQKIEAMLSVYSRMKQKLNKQKVFMQSQWAESEAEIDKLQTNTLKIHGSLSGLIDDPMPEIRAISFREETIMIEAMDEINKAEDA